MLSSVLTLAVATSALVIPVGASAQDYTTSDINVEKLQQQKETLEFLRTVKETREERIQAAEKAASQTVLTKSLTKSESFATTATTGTSLSYTNTLKSLEIHTYAFKLDQGTSVTLSQSGSNGVTWAVYDAEMNIFHMSTDGNTVTGLTAGTQYFVDVFGDEFSEVQQNYSITINGTQLTGDTTLPTLNLSNPTSSSTVLPYGTKSFTMKGTHNGDVATLYFDEQEYPLASSFSRSVAVSGGAHGYGVVVSKASGNVVYQIGDVFVKDLKRLAGLDRYKTAIAISQEMYPETGITETVVIARGDNFADAVAGGPLAYMLDGPLLLTPPTKLNDSTKAELLRLKPKKAIILGGTGAVDTNTENAIKALGITVERFAGVNRFETSVKAADRFVKTAKSYGFDVDSALIANGNSFADPLSASGVGGAYLMPILTSPPSYLDNSTYNFLKVNPLIKNFYVIGNTTSIQKAVTDKLATLGGTTIDRTSGTNSYQVNANVAHKFFEGTETHAFVVANGDNFPDGLAGGPLANTVSGPLLFTPATTMNADVKNYINTTNPMMIFISGGSGVVSDSIQAELIKKLQ